ncbi:MAG: hypothetical protein DRJ51_03660 [Thermoprotei archaeon]|nr:MAG: hypothetical protein DRJ51_03660 [Thermoprotei archaeon]RLF03477.1 MAG: hypothetical protein DRJ59_00570 [Thermoprotei archaeon]
MIVSLLTDFGLRDPYVAIMKAVMMSINPRLSIVDITHEVSKYNVREASFILASAFKYFPKGTIHVVVVDPGVGTARKGLIVKTNNYVFVGPDNGVLLPAALMNGIREVYQILEEKVRLPGRKEEVSYTFHGRDVFAPVAAFLSLGTKPSELGIATSDYLVPSFARPRFCGGGILGEVLYIDSFGNIVTNIPKDYLSRLGVKEGEDLEITFQGKLSVKLKFHKTYGECKVGKMLTLIDSFGFLEIAINMGNAANVLGVNVGDKVRVRKQGG